MKALLFGVLALLMAVPAAGQDDKAQFLAALKRALEYKDNKAIDQAIKKFDVQAMEHFEGLCWDKQKNGTPSPAWTAMMESWERIYGKRATLESYDRWVGFQGNEERQRVFTARQELIKVWNMFSQLQKSGAKRTQWDALRNSAIQVAEKLQRMGHVPDASQTWVLVAQINTNMPGLTIQDRKDGIFALERFLEVRKSWQWTEDIHFQRNTQVLKGEKNRLEEAITNAEKRAKDGYAEGTEGVEGLVEAGSKTVSYDMTFKALRDYNEADYYVKGGPVPVRWMDAAINTADTTNTQKRDDGKLYSKMPWFTRVNLLLVQDGMNKYSIAVEDPMKAMPVKASSKPKPSTFYLAPDKKEPYAMWFYLGSDQDMVGSVQLNLVPTADYTPVFYRSAASWETEIGEEKVVFYDDNADGKLFTKDPFEYKYTQRILGNPEGTEVPLLDSMRIGKGPRVPFTEFVKIGEAWYYLEGVAGGAKPGTRPLNPQYFKTGKVALKWKGHKKGKPQFVVIRGKGVYGSAMYDIASAKEVEVPVGEYQVIFGRMVQGKGARTMSACIFQGTSKGFTVEEGKTLEFEMGADVHFAFEWKQTGKTASADMSRLQVKDGGGHLYAMFQNCTPTPDVFWGPKPATKKGKKMGSMISIQDGQMVNQLGQTLTREVAGMPVPKGNKSDMVLRLEVPARGGGLGLTLKKPHPLLGKTTLKLLPATK